jgi:hypothetical protein
MSEAELHFQQTFVGTVTQTTDIVLAGESSAAPIIPNHTIEVTCNLSNVVSYAGAYVTADYALGRAAAYPSVTILVGRLTAAAALIDGIFTDKDSADLLDAPNAATPTLQGVFRNHSWVFSDNPVFSSNPLEAVVSVTYGEIDATPFHTAVASSTLWGPTDVGTSAAMNLFEQCLAAGKVEAGTLSNADATGSASFDDGDSISLYVTYTLTKTRSYTADPDLSGGGTATITVGGATVGLTPRTEVAEPVEKKIRWKFVHSSSAAIPQ